ncbi:MAG: TDP-N-acetylfucosamine:lipid II N-acetylfucosaminyltransferase [Bacteroidales bacterium]|nr:TDP-N-acetylfucosamine:lipid II N-acetylfucosaminyltransferase [Bacteroidales bacterium]
MSKQSLHLILDDKFVDSFIEMIDKYDNLINHTFIAYNIPQDRDFKYIKSKNVIKYDWDSAKIKFDFVDFSKYKKLFIHYLDPRLYPLIRKLPLNIKIYWIIYGADMFIPQVFNDNALFDKYSKSYLKKKKFSVLRFLPYKIWRLLPIIKNFRSNFKKKKAVSRINYILHYNYFDYTYLKEKMKVNAKFLRFNYTGIKSILNEELENNITDKFKYADSDKIIIVGNSANLTNNQLGTVPILKNLSKYFDFKIISFLSYGQEHYAKHLTQKFSGEFGEKFIPILSFLPKKEYFNILKRADIAIMNNYRSQGAGIILSLLYYGKKVFMSEKSLLYQFYLYNGIRVFSIEKDLENSKKNLFKPLSESEKKDNKNLIKNLFWNEEILRINMENIFRT